MQVVLNKDLKFSNKERVEQTAKEQIESGYWISCDKEQYVNHTITHEFGHYVQRVLMEKDRQTKDGKERYINLKDNIKKCNNQSEVNKLIREYSEEFATKCFKGIQRIHRKNFGKECSSDISRYGKENNRETFAELFANLNNSKEPNNLAKAMGIYLEKNMNVRTRIDKKE